MEIFKTKDNSFLFIRETTKSTRYEVPIYESLIVFFDYDKESKTWGCGAFGFESEEKLSQKEFYKLFGLGKWDTLGWSCGSFENFEDAAEECFGKDTKFSISEWSKIWRLSKEMEEN